MKCKQNLIWWNKPSLPPLQKIELTQSTKQTNHNNIKVKKDKSIRNESDKSRSLDKSKSTQRTETEDTVKTLNKSESISLAIFSDKSIKIENPK